MKCDELEAEQWLDYSGEPMPCYQKAKADAAIAELKDENRRLKRALYKACANWMIDRQCAMSCFHLEARAKKFDKAIEKCRAKAEEYK